MIENTRKEETFFDKIKTKYRLVVFNDATLDEKFSAFITPLSLFTAIGLTVIILVTTVTILIAYTPLREFIPGYTNSELVKQTYLNREKVDSLEMLLKSIEIYNKNHRAILEDNIKTDTTIIGKNNNKNEIFETEDKLEVKPAKSKKTDSTFRANVENEESSNIKINSKDNSIGNTMFFTPIKGPIINKYNTKKAHFGVDVSAPENTVIKAVADGVVTVANWTVETGFLISIQHKNNFVSYYKHSSKLLKEVGNKVKAGESIAIIGNTSENIIGPHLHFELWHKGQPINPTNYIKFN